ncbi:hypothetical protein MUP77_04580 [Candidatus Bathyarchaeota archaeon]|nr:hypothetical protein [Candidatus Bathyarchaeota archaeon]
MKNPVNKEFKDCSSKQRTPLDLVILSLLVLNDASFDEWLDDTMTNKFHLERKIINGKPAWRMSPEIVAALIKKHGVGKIEDN